MRLPRSLAAAALACTLALAPARARAQDPRVTVRARAAVQAPAGGAGTAVFHAANPGARPVVARATVRMPAGWSLVAPPEALTIPAGGAALWLLPFRVPSDAAAGTYAVHLSSFGAADSVVVTVPALRGLTAEVVEAPRFVAAGDSIVARVRVRNAGNVAETVRVSAGPASSSTRGAASPASPPLVLAPGAEGEVAIRLATATNLRAVTRQRVVARVIGDGDGAPSASAEAVVEVVPRAAGDPGRHTLPAEVRVRMNGASGDVVPSLAGAGTISRGGGARVDFLLRGPEAPSRFSRPDEYRLSLSTPRFDVRLGDQAYGLTPLTSPATYGFGGEAAARLGPLTARGYAVGDRRGDGAVEGGGLLELVFGRRGMVGAGVLMPRDGGTVLTGRTRLSAGALAVLDAEVAGGGAGGAAHDVSLQGAVPGLSYRVRHQAADADFAGAAHGVETAEGRVSLSLPGRAYVTGEAVRREASPFALGGAREVWERRVRAGIGGVFAAEARATEQDDPRRGSWDARAVRVSGTARLGRATLTPSVEVGEGTGDDGEAHPFRRVAAQAAVDGRSLSLAATVDVLEGRANVYDAEGTTLTGGLRATARPLPGTEIRAEVRGSRRGDAGRTVRYADVSVDQHVIRGHRLVGRVQVTDDGFGGTAEPVITLDYVVPVGVPMQRDGGTGAASGRLYDAATGAPLRGVLVRVGDRSSVTDAQGRWTVAGLKPGVHAVQLDRLSLGAGLVPSSPAGPSATVRGGRTARVDVGVVRAGRISGRVVRMDSASVARGEGGVPLPAAVVVLAGPGEEVRRRVDEDGRFDLPGLRPGTWQARVDGGVPEHHRADAATTVELAPGESEEMTLRVLPVARQLVFVDGGTVTVGAERARRPAVAARPASPPPTAQAATRVAVEVAGPTTPNPAAASPVPARGEAARPASPPAGVETARPASPSPSSTARTGDTRDRRPPSPPVRYAVPEMPAEYAAMYRETLAVHERYEVQEGDAGLMAIALFVYNDGSLWPKLWLANVDLMPDPDDLAPGMVLRIPPKAPLTPAERAAVAARAAARRR